MRVTLTKKDAARCERMVAYRKGMCKIDCEINFSWSDLCNEFRNILALIFESVPMKP